jgi:biopolymer transport protein ExbD
VSRRRRGRRAAPDGLNLTPLLDVIFNLVFFFVVATQIKATSSLLDMKLPASSSGTETRELPRVPVVGIAADGSLTLDGRAMAAEEVGRELARRRASQPIEQVLLDADQSATMQHLITATDVIRNAGIRTVSPRVRRAPGS